MVADTVVVKGKGLYPKTRPVEGRVCATAESAEIGKTMWKSHENTCDVFTTSEILMTDGGPELDNKEGCAMRGTKLEICPAYSPWINGLP